MIRVTRRPAAMLHRMRPWGRVFAGFALTLLVASVVSVCVTGHPDAGDRVVAEPAAAAGHDHHVKPGMGRGIEPVLITADPAPHGGDHRHYCCSHHVSSATEAAAQRPEVHQPAGVTTPVPTHSLLLESLQSPVNAGPAPPAPSLIQLSISRT